MSKSQPQDDPLQYCPPTRVHRRDFVLGGIKITASLLLLDWLHTPASAQPDPTALPAGLDDSVKQIATYLQKYAPPRGNIPATGPWAATYDMLGWNGTPGKVPARDDLLGQLSVISRPVPGGGAIGYEVNYSIRLNAWESGFKSTMQCSADRLPSLISWRTDYENHSLKHPALSWALTEQGRCEDGLLEITGKAGTRRFKTDRPVAPQWAVLDAVRAAKPDLAGLEFDLLHDLTSYRPRQKLKPCGTLDIALDGQPFQFHGFLQKGTATEPTHYWVDAAGRPLILTGGMLSLAMTSIRPA